MSSVFFRLDLEPVAQPRHKVGTGFGGRPRAYIPDDHPVHDFKQRVSAAALLAMHGRAKISEPLAAHLLFAFERPKSDEKLLGYSWRGIKPDCDNLQKSLLDACNGVVYIDDSLVCDVRAVKVTVPYGEAPFLFAAFSACDPAHRLVTDWLDVWGVG